MPSESETERTYRRDLEAARGQGDLTGAVTLEEARQAHRRLIDEAARIDLSTDMLELLGRLGRFLNAL